jgi:tetratricopeptide (TPR) repeat protein
MGRDKIINTDSAQVWKNLGECYARRQEFESAHFAYNNALEIQNDARKQAEKLCVPFTDGCDDATLADTLLRLGNCTKETHRYEDAHKTYKEALLIYRMHYTTAHRSSNGRISDTLADAQDRLAHTLYCIAEVQQIRGIYEEAEALYGEALQLRLHSDAQRTQSRMNMVHCAMALAGIGSCHMKNSEFDDAISVYKESIKYLVVHGVPEDHTLMQNIKGRLMQCEQGIVSNQTFADDGDHGEDGDITLAMDEESKRFMEEGKYDEAIETLSKALSIRRRRLTKRQKDELVPENIPEKEDVAMTLVNYATILFQKSEIGQAAALTKEAIRTYKSCGYDDDHPAVSSLKQQLNKLNAMYTL